MTFIYSYRRPTNQLVNESINQSTNQYLPKKLIRVHLATSSVCNLSHLNTTLSIPAKLIFVLFDIFKHFNLSPANRAICSNAILVTEGQYDRLIECNDLRHRKTDCISASSTMVM